MPSIIDDPDGFKGHGAGSDFAFARKFGPCIKAFIEQGQQAAALLGRIPTACTTPPLTCSTWPVVAFDVVGSEEHGGARDLVGRQQLAAERDGGARHLDQLGVGVAVARLGGVGGAGRDGIDADVVGRELERHARASSTPRRPCSRCNARRAPRRGSPARRG